jgi:Protein of unknown function (DUF2917)
MSHNHYPFATQDWSLIRHRTLVLNAAQVRAIESLKGELWITVEGNCNDYFVKPGDSVDIPCRDGRVVIESTSALAAQSPLVQHVGPSFADALAVSILRPLATGFCRASTVLRNIAAQLDPKLART